MAINLNSETVISLTEATRLLPARRGGKRPHVSCIYRWTVTGCKGVILESIQVGGTRCTSKEALARFFERLTTGSRDIEPRRTPSQRERAATNAMMELEQLGA